MRAASGGARTHNLWLRRPTLYPVELRTRSVRDPKVVCAKGQTALLTLPPYSGNFRTGSSIAFCPSQSDTRRARNNSCTGRIRFRDQTAYIRKFAAGFRPGEAEFLGQGDKGVQLTKLHSAYRGKYKQHPNKVFPR
jgi:hypothetical protein